MNYTSKNLRCNHTYATVAKIAYNYQGTTYLINMISCNNCKILVLFIDPVIKMKKDNKHCII